MTNIHRILEYAFTNPMYTVAIILLITFSITIFLKKRVSEKIFLVLMSFGIIIFVIMVVLYDNAVMPKALETDEIYRLEKTLCEEYTEVKALEVRDVGGAELSFSLLLNEEISEDLSKEILNKIRSMVIGKAFENDIEDYYWSKYYLQHSFEVKFEVKKETLYTYYASRGVNDTNIDLNEWDAYNHLTEERLTVRLK